MAFFAITISPFSASANAKSNHEITLQLKWSHAYQFAGYYAAKELGFYDDVGLNVSIVEATPGIDAVTEVIEGRAQFGTGNSSLLLSRHKGLPVVVLNVIFQHSPAVIISRGADSAPLIDSLKRKRIMVEPNSDELLAYLYKSGIKHEEIEVVEHSHTVDDLIDGNVDAISAYSSYEPFLLNSKGFYFHLYTPRESGIDFYGDNLFTSRAVIEQNPREVEAFRNASLKGWKYAMAHPDEIIDLILTKYDPELDPDFLKYEFQKMQELLAANLVEVGYMNIDRWGRILATYQELGYNLEKTILEGFIYKPYVTLWEELSRYKWYLAFLLFVFIILSVRNYQLKSFNRQLNKVASEDALTGLFNRKHIDETLNEEHRRSRRYGRIYSVIMCDIDHFKEVNDEHGHHIGDQILKEVSSALESRTRSTDTLGRWGGEEFLLICPETDFRDALSIAEALRKKVADKNYTANRIITLSLGVATLDENDEIIDIVNRADKALYAAKNEGRNTVKGFNL